jgi:hypothetical protein
MMISKVHRLPAITYSHFQSTPYLTNQATKRGPIMAPTPNNASAPFIVPVCCLVEVEISPINAKAAVLNIPTAIPDKVMKPRIKAKLVPTKNI